LSTISGQKLGAISPRTLCFLAATGASWLCYFRALKLGDAARVAPIDKFSIVFVAILATAFLGETLTAGNLAGIALISLGAILVATT
jgi:transporter family protein